ncbi:MAG: carboxypeptidase regulatory-like domain-containing protein [Planctomycetes bacterium]|nr:carboxypeptidase regulatory-like domain-containing protein [Planctomycetota bacterium]
MRKNRLMLALLLLVLIAGAGVGIWLATSPGNDHRDVAGADIEENGENPSLDSGDPLAGSNTAPGAKGDKPDSGETTTHKNPADAGNNTGSKQPDSTDPEHKAGDNDPPAAKVEWVPAEVEATVSGRVTFKSDGRPAVGAAIRLEVDEGRSEMWRVRNKEPKGYDKDKPATEFTGTTTTDGAGEFSMRVKMKYWYQKLHFEDGEDRSLIGFTEEVAVIATSPGYAPAKSPPFRLDADKEQTVALTLAIPAAVSGRVVDSVSHEGIAGARGTLMDIDAIQSGRPPSPYSFTTDDKGYFSLNSLPASSYSMSIQADGYADYSSWSNTGRTNLSRGGETNLGDIPMMRSTGVSGRVIDAESGEPIEGASIELRKPQQWGGVSTSNASSDEEGLFHMQEVEPGNYSVRVRKEGYAISLLEGVTAEVGKELELGDIRLDHGMQLHGVVTGPDSAPLEGVQIELSEPPSANFNFGTSNRKVSDAISDEEGKFVLGGVSEGKWQISAKLSGYADYNEAIEVGAKPEALTIRMTRGGSIRGRMLDADGNPVSGARIGATSHDARSYALFKSQPQMLAQLLLQEAVATERTDENGDFLLENVPEGVYVVVGISGELGPQETPGQVWKDDIRVQDERETDIGDLQPPRPGTLQVTVTEDGVTVADVEVRVTSGMGMMGGGLTGVTSSTGVAKIENIPEGTWYLKTSRDQSQFDTDLKSRRVVVRAGETTEFQLELRPKGGVHLHGRVTMNGKASISDIILMGMGGLSDVMKSIKPLEGGYYEFNGLKVGSYVMHVREGDKLVTAKMNLELTEEGDKEVNRDFKGYKVSGSVATPDDSPAQRSSVSVTIAHANPEKPSFNTWLRGSTNCGTGGTFLFESVTAGEYIVTASLEGIGSASTHVSITSADINSLNLTISNNSGKIKLTLSKLTGTPVSGGGFASLTLLDATGATVDLGESFQGFFMISQGSTQTIPTVPPGTYTVQIRGSGYLPKDVEGVTVQQGQTTETDVELTAAAELHMTVTNPEVTQAMLDAAEVHYYDANGSEVPIANNPFDAMTPGDPPAAPTLISKYIGPSVAQVRVKLAGYTEVTIDVAFAAGKKIEKQEMLLTE